VHTEELDQGKFQEGEGGGEGWTERELQVNAETEPFDYLYS